MMACPYGGYGMPSMPGPPGGPAPGGATAESVVGLLSPYQVDRIKRNVQLLSVVDLSSVKERAFATEEGVEDYKKFLALRAMVTEMTSNDDLMTSPTSNMDALWHEHVLDTRAYQRCCEMLLGSSHRIIHHDPKVIKDLTAKSARLRALKELWDQVFDEPPQEGWDIDPVDQADYVRRLSSRKRPRETATAVEIFVKTLMTGKSHTLRIDPDAIVEDLKVMVADVVEVPVDKQRLIFSGTQLSDGQTLWSYGIEKHSTVDLVLRLTGC